MTTENLENFAAYEGRYASGRRAQGLRLVERQSSTDAAAYLTLARRYAHVSA